MLISNMKIKDKLDLKKKYFRCLLTRERFFLFFYLNIATPGSFFWEKCYQSLGREKTFVINFVIAGFHRMGSGNTGRERKWKMKWTRLWFIYLFAHVFLPLLYEDIVGSSGKPPFVLKIYGNISDAFLPRFISLKNKHKIPDSKDQMQFFRTMTLMEECHKDDNTIPKKGVSRINRL